MERHIPTAAFGRLMISTLFILSGLEKLAEPIATQASIALAGLPQPVLTYAAAATVEIIGGVLLIAGYRTRAVAFALALFTIASAIVFHRVPGDMNQHFHFLKNLAITGGLLQLVAFGAGRVGVDANFPSAGALSGQVAPGQ